MAIRAALFKAGMPPGILIALSCPGFLAIVFERFDTKSESETIKIRP
jgi:hypothetical protein